MKEIINFYYNFYVEEMEEHNNYCYFSYYGEDFYFAFLNRSEEELNELVDISDELRLKNIKVHDIILNRDKKIITKVNEKPYVMLKINGLKTKNITFLEIVENINKLKLNKKNSNLYRNNWSNLWSDKVDYFEYQIKEIGKNKKVILDSFSYYIGLAENSISYVNKVNSIFSITENDNIVLSHRRIFYPNIALNYYNPLSFIFDLEVRDVAEYLKISFFNGNDSLLDLITFLKTKRLTNYSYHLLYARLLYPSYYFDIYENIMNNNEDDIEKLIYIINRVNDYEQFLKLAYLEINKYTSLEKIDWIIKKEL